MRLEIANELWIQLDVRGDGFYHHSLLRNSTSVFSAVIIRKLYLTKSVDIKSYQRHLHKHVSMMWSFSTRGRDETRHIDKMPIYLLLGLIKDRLCKWGKFPS